MVLFIIFIVSMGVKMINSKEALYEDDYYEQGEMHAKRMEQEEIGQPVSVVFNRSKNSLDVTFDSTGYVSGYKMVYLADNSLDFDEKSLADSPVKDQSLLIPRDLKSGIWVLEIMGIVEGETFFKKQQFVK
jgi:hypothetical protein